MKTAEELAREWLLKNTDAALVGSSKAEASLAALIRTAQADAVRFVKDAKVEELAKARVAGAEEALSETWDDRDDEWSEQIEISFPSRSGSHDEYGMAMKMVGNRHSKGALVALVNWLLVRLAPKSDTSDQAEIDERRRRMADEIINGTNPEYIYQVAKNWVITAAQHAANEAYYRNERDSCEQRVAGLIVKLLEGYEERLRDIVKRDGDPQMRARLGVYEGMAQDIRDRKWVKS
jgi:hypothetical protein